MRALISNRKFQLVCVFVGYFLFAKAGLALATINNNASPMWPATGFSIFCALIFGNRALLPIFAGAFLANYSIPSAFLISIGIAVGNTLEAAIGRRIYITVARRRAEFNHLTGTLALIATTALASLVSATIGILTLAAFSIVDFNQAFSVFTTWYGGDLIGGVVLLPLLLEVRRRIRRRAKVTWQEVAAAAVGIFAFICIFTWAKHSSLLFLAFPICLFALLYGSPLSAKFIVNVICVVCGVGAYYEIGPYLNGDLNVNVLHHVVFILSLSLTATVMVSFHELQFLSRNARHFLWIWLAAAMLTAGFELDSDHQDRRTFNEMTKNYRDRVIAHMGLYESALKGGVALFRASEEVDRLEWKAFSDEFGLVINMPGAFGFGFIEYVPDKDAKAFVEGLKTRDALDKPIFPVPKTEFSAGADHYVVKYVEPYRTLSKVIGLDIATDPARRYAADLARDTGRAAMTEGIRLVRDEKARDGFLLLSPIYKNNLPPATHEQRRANIVGWVYAPFVAEDFFLAAIAEPTLPQDNIVEVSFTEEHAEVPLFSTLTDRSYRGDLFTEQTLEIAQRRFVMRAEAGKAFHYSRDTRSAWSGALAALIGLVALSIVTNLQVSNRRIKLMVEKKARELEVHRAKSLESSRLAALGEMAGGIAHEINNPLAIIMARAEKLRMENENITDRKSIETIVRTAERIAKIVSGMRNLSRDGTNQPMEEIRLQQLVEDSLSVCREKFKSHGIDLRLNLDEDEVVFCRHIEISQVLVNLLNNAEHAIEHRQDPWIEIRSFTEGDFAGIEVVDCGEGISPFVVSRMMEPFFTTKEIGKGTGLGLSIAQNIVANHGGRLEYRADRPNTTFAIKLPRRVPHVLNTAA